MATALNQQDTSPGIDNEQSLPLKFKRIDGPWSWILCCSFFLCNVLAYGFIATYGILFPNILKEFNSGRAVTAIPGSLSITSASLYGIVIGKLCDRYGCRKAMLIGGVSCALGLVVSSFAPVISVLVLSYGLVLGLGVCLVYLSTMVTIPVYFDKYSFEATSIVSTGPATGLIIMSPIVQQFNKVLGWRTSMQCMSSFTVIFCIVGLLMRSSNTMGTQDNGQHSRLTCKACNLIDFSAFKIKVFVLAVIINIIVALGHLMPFLHLAKFCDDIGISSNLSSWLYFTIGILSTISRLFVSKFGKKGCLTLPNILLFGIISLAIGDFILPSVSQFHWLVLYCVNFGIGDGLFATAVINIAIECLPTENRGGGFGLYQFLVGTSYILGPILSGFIADVSGSYNYSFYTAGSLEILGGSVTLLLFCFTTPHVTGETEENSPSSKARFRRRASVAPEPNSLNLAQNSSTYESKVQG